MLGSDEKLREQLEASILALRASEARFRNVITGNADGIIIVDKSGVIRFANPAAATLFNRPESQLLGESFGFPIVSGETTELEIVRHGEVAIAEVRVSDTEWDGKPARLLTMRDTTERRRAEKELRKMYRAVLESPGMVMITDPHGLIEFVNPKFTEVTGYSLPDIAGKDPSFLTSGREPAEVYRDLTETIRAGREWRGELVSRKKNGELFWQSVAISPITDFDGYIINFVGVMSDITERKKADEALRRSEKKFAALFGATPALLAVSTLEEGRLIEVNEKVLKTLGYSREELVGRTSLELGIWANPADRDTMVRTLLEEGKVRDREFVIRGKTGDTFVGLMSAEIIEIDQERCMLTMIKDITDRKLAEARIEKLNTDLAARAAELEAANQELEAFNYSVAHDLRGPLTVINGYCQLISEMCGANLDDSCREYLAQTNNVTLRMNQLIDALLRFSSVAHTEPHRETIDLSEMALTIAGDLKMKHPERRSVFLIAGDIRVSGDPKLLRVVLNNLLGNAWKYTGEREETVIEFGQAEIDGKPVCFVRDNGEGFPMVDADMLFLPFRRLHGSEQFKGFGIGLATVERIIRRHGGRIWAEGTPGKGATFYFTLEPDRICM